MARTDLGEKQICPSCGAKFYDLGRRPAACPKCATTFDPADEGVRVRRGRSRVSAHDADYEDEDEELEGKKAAKRGDDDDDEGEEDAPEVDAEAADEVVLNDDDEDDGATPSGDELPAGFSEEEADLGDDAADDDSVPLLEDEEEFPEDEIGDLPAGDDDDSGR